MIFSLGSFAGVRFSRRGASCGFVGVVSALDFLFDLGVWDFDVVTEGGCIFLCDFAFRFFGSRIVSRFIFCYMNFIIRFYFFDFNVKVVFIGVM